MVHSSNMQDIMQGYCETTSIGEGHWCTGRKGAWPIADEAQCLAACAACPRCYYVSHSMGGPRMQEPDCSWFASCDMSQLHNTYPLSAPAELRHKTFRVRRSDGTLLDRPASLELTAAQRLGTVEWMRNLVDPSRAWLVQVGANVHAPTSYFNVRSSAHSNSYCSHCHKFALQVWLRVSAPCCVACSQGDPGPEAVRLGWRADLLEPIPKLAAILRAKYRSNARVRVHSAAVCGRRLHSSKRAGRTEGVGTDAGEARGGGEHADAQEASHAGVTAPDDTPAGGGCAADEHIAMWSVDISNSTGNWGSPQADTRCLGQRGQWVTEIASVKRAHVLKHQGAFQPSSRSVRALCSACAERLGRPLQSDCLSEVLTHNLVRVRVPCFCMERLRRRGGDVPAGEPVVGDAVGDVTGDVTLLMIDAEGHDVQARRVTVV